MRIKIRKIIKNVIQKDEKNTYSKTQLRVFSKNNFDKIYLKINKKKFNYFEINENIVAEIMKELEENKNSKDRTIDSLQSQQVSYCQNTNKSENSNLEKEITYSQTPSCSGFDEIENLFNNENTLENLLYQEKLDQKFNKMQENFSYKQSFDLFAWSHKSVE